MKKRIFIALNFPPEIKSKIKSLIKKLEKSSRGVKWINPQGAHITMAFLGWLTKEEIAKVTAILKIVSNNQEKFELNLENIGFFPTISLPRVIWIGGSQDLNIINLKSSLKKQLNISGFKVEDREFIPHLTIGRIKDRVKNIENITNFRNVNLGKFLVSSIDVMESILKREGPEYKTIFRVNLKNS